MITRCAVLLACALLLGCTTGEADDPTAAEADADVAVCDDLRRRENELIAVANQALAEVGAATDDGARRRAIAEGYERLLATIEAQAVAAEDVDPALRQALRDGAAAAADELRDERDGFLAAHPDGVAAADERGVVGALQTALEKAFSNLEPPREVYRRAGLAEATDADPDCRFVTQRRDPSA